MAQVFRIKLPGGGAGTSTGIVITPSSRDEVGVHDIVKSGLTAKDEQGRAQ